MKRLLLIITAVLLLSATAVPLIASEVTIGTGNQQARLPVDTWYRNSLFECMYYPDELNIISGNINGVAFYNNFVSTNAESLHTKIWLGTTTLIDLSNGWIPSTSLTLVYDGSVSFPEGQNTIPISFSTPFFYNGGNLVMMVHRPTDTHTYNSNDNFYTQTIGTTRARIVYGASAYDPEAPPVGTATTGRFPKTTFVFTGLSTIQDDIACISVTGSVNPSIESVSEYVVKIKNNGQSTQNNYSVRLMQEDGTVLGNIAGNPIHDAEEQTYTFSWIPTTIGPISIFGRTVLNQDQVPANNQSPSLPINVQPAGTQSYTIGQGNQLARMPINMYYRSSLFETIYLASELDMNGIITGIQLYNDFSTNLPNMQTNIWMGETTLEDLSGGWIPSTQLTHVFSGGVTYPLGENNVFISFSTPIVYGGGNLVLMMERPMDNQYYDMANNFKCQTVGSTRTRIVQSRTEGYNPASPPTDASNTGQFPKITFLYNNQLISNDISCMNLIGESDLRTGTQYEYVATIRNNGLDTQNDYQVKLMKEGDIELSSITGNSIAFSEVQTYTFSYIPTSVGATYLYCKVVMTGDEVPENDQSSALPVRIWEEGTSTVTIGIGNFLDRMPIDIGYKNSLFECLFYQNELTITSGTISGIVFYNNFTIDLPAPKPTRIWLGNTNQTDLTGGWIPSTDLTLVFDGLLDYPLGQNNIEVFFDIPFMYHGATLVMMVQRPWDDVWYLTFQNFYCQAIGNVRSLREASTEVVLNPAAPPTDTVVSGLCPKTTFYVREAGNGSLSGSVSFNGTPVEDAIISITNTTLTARTDATGHYNFPHIITGTYEINVAAHGFNTASSSITITEGQPHVADFVLVPLPLVTVTGRIVGSNDLSTGISSASIALSGYDSFSSISNQDGYFSLTGVFGNQGYQYSIRAAGYQLTSNPVLLSEVDVNMGTIVVNEIANAPRNVIARENASHSQVDITWQPQTELQDITEGFEGDLFPPHSWTQVITDTGSQDNSGLLPTWCSVGSINSTPPIIPHSGIRQAGLRWSVSHQDEWLKTPMFICPPSASLVFWSHVYLGSLNGDHYYVKVSTDDNITWTILWDASALSGGWNNYDSPITIDLSSYAGMQITVAWNARDSSLNNGLWYSWFIDSIIIESPTGNIAFPTTFLTTQHAHEHSAVHTFNPNSSWSPNRSVSSRQVKSVEPDDYIDSRDRVMIGYRIWRLLSANQDILDNWVLMTPEPIPSENYSDTAWESLPTGIYKYAVRAIFSNNVQSNAAFSNDIHKRSYGTLTGTITEMETNAPIAGVSVTAGTYSGTTDANGIYSFYIAQGTYTIVATKACYRSSFQIEVIIQASETVIQNFVLEELILPVGSVQAVVEGSDVISNWMTPGTFGGQWIHYDSGEQSHSVGTGTAAAYDVAIRFPASALVDYAGMSLYSLKVWPTEPGIFAIKVWTGGDASGPANLVVHQAFVPNLNTYTTVHLDSPVFISGTEELWFGYNCTVTSGYPAGCDNGPQVDGFSNMLFYNGIWYTLSNINSDLTYNWNIQGYVGYSIPDRESSLSTPYAGLAKHIKSENRALSGYKVWRLLQGHETDEDAWTSLTDDPIFVTVIQDTGWSNLQEGAYKWSVKAVYANGVMSNAAFSNVLTKIDETGIITGVVRNSSNECVSGATVTAGSFTAITDNNGTYSMTVDAGVYCVTVYSVGYETISQEGVIVSHSVPTTINFTLSTSGWIFADSFETYEDFDLSFDPWTLVDTDQSTTQSLANYYWPYSELPQAFVIFNPTATIPPMSNVTAHDGIKFAACAAASSPPNDDWMISPQIYVPKDAILQFWARSLSDQYGLERFKVGVSCDGTSPENFTYISGTTYLQAPTDWTEYSFDLSAYAHQQICFGIQCVSHDALMLMIDDLHIYTTVGNSDVNNAPLYTRLGANYPNPFNPETTIRFSVKEKCHVNISIYNIKGQLVKTSVNEEMNSGYHSVVWNGTDNHGRDVSSGVYFYKMSAGNYSSIKKMIVMK